MTRRGWLLFAAMGLIWGIPYLLIKVAVGGLHPATLVFLRTTVGALLLVPLAASRGDLRALLAYWRPLLVYTFVEVAAPWFLLADAERRLSSSLTGLLIAAVGKPENCCQTSRRREGANCWSFSTSSLTPIDVRTTRSRPSSG
jgi:drug/metabolite transporter (DMT)-like permease